MDVIGVFGIGEHVVADLGDLDFVPHAGFDHAFVIAERIVDHGIRRFLERQRLAIGNLKEA